MTYFGMLIANQIKTGEQSNEIKTNIYLICRVTRICSRG